MTNMLYELGVLNESHIAVLPSSFIYDFAPLIMAKMITSDSDHELFIKVGNASYDALNYNLVDIRYPTVTEQVTRNDDNWLDMRRTFQKSVIDKNEISMNIKSSNHYTGYLQIRPPEEKYTKGYWRYDVSSGSSNTSPL